MEYKRSRHMMWTDIEVIIISFDNDCEKILDIIFSFLNWFEQEFSRFLPHSPLSILNLEKKFQVPERFLNLLKLSILFNRDTNGYFNPLSDISTKWYSKDFSWWVFEKSGNIQNLDLSAIVIDWNNITLRKDQNLDFSWIAKWFAADLAGDILYSFWIDNYLINVWWDIFAKWLNGDNSKWVIWIEDPFSDKLLWQVEISDSALATSGSYKRKWTIWNENHHHILNTKTLDNSNEFISVTVSAETWAQADAYTKAAFNMSASEIENLVKAKEIWLLTVKHSWELSIYWNFKEKLNFINY